MSEPIKPRPNIAQLEDLLNQTEEGEIEILPSGEVVRLGTVERLEKKYQLERGRADLLRKEVDRLRRVLDSIITLAKDERAARRGGPDV